MQVSWFTKIIKSRYCVLDARVKVTVLISFSLAVIIFSSPYSIGVLLAAACISALRTSRLRTVIMLFGFTSLMLGATVLSSWGLSRLISGFDTWNFSQLVVPYMRLLAMFMTVLAVALSTPPHSLLHHLAASRLPTIITIPLSVAIRFFPSFIDDCRQIRDVVRLRPKHGIRSVWRGSVVPLVFRVMASTDDLALAATLKGVSAAVRPVVPLQPRLSLFNWFFLIFTFILVLFAASLEFFFLPVQRPA